MGKKVHTNIKKNLQQKNHYQNMVKKPTKDLEDTNDNYTELFPETSKVLVEDEIYYNENNTTKKPITARISEFGNDHVVGIMISIIGVFFVWCISLQIADVRKQEKIEALKEDIIEINTQIKDMKDLYIRKDIFDLKIDNLEEKIEEINRRIDGIK